MSIRAVLQAAYELLQDPAHWCRRTLARDANGDAVSPEDERAVSWCMIGAIDKVARPGHRRASVLWLKNGESLISINDWGTHEEVLAHFRSAIWSAPN